MRGLQCACGKGGLQGRGRHSLLCQPAHQFDGRRGLGITAGGHSGSAGRRLRRGGQGRCQRKIRSRRRVKGYRIVQDPQTAHRVARLFARADVCVDGSYDWIAAAAVLGGKPCGTGADTAAACGDRDGHQPKILYQRLQGLGTPCAEYGHPCGARLGRFVCMERLCALSHDGGAAER